MGHHGSTPPQGMHCLVTPKRNDLHVYSLKPRAAGESRMVEQQSGYTALSDVQITESVLYYLSKSWVSELRRSLSEQSSRVTELEQEVEVLEGELSAAQQAAKQAPSRTMKSLVDRLRNQLSVKEKQQRVRGRGQWVSNYGNYIKWKVDCLLGLPCGIT